MLAGQHRLSLVVVQAWLFGKRMDVDDQIVRL